jgi:hypothetical protein
MAMSVAQSADLSKWSYEKTYTSEDATGCSCDAPGVVGTVCATPYRCREISGLCVGSCVAATEDRTGCACDAPGVDLGVAGPVCATPYRCKEMSGLCVGRC